MPAGLLGPQPLAAQTGLLCRTLSESGCTSRQRRCQHDFFIGNGGTGYSSTTLGSDFTLNSLTFNSSATGPIGISGANTLNMAAGSSITALAGSGSVNIGATVAFAINARDMDRRLQLHATILTLSTINATGGDTISTTVDGITVSYVTVAGDTTKSAAIALANAINSNASLAGLVNATVSGNVINIAGNQGVATATNLSSTGSDTGTATAGSAMTFSGNITGTGARDFSRNWAPTINPSGQFIFSGAAGYNGAITLLNSGTSLTLNGSGTLLSATGITLGGGSALTLDDLTSGNAGSARLVSNLAVSSKGGTINVLGSSTAASSEQIGALSLATGETNVNVTPGSGQTATFTIASLNRLAGAAVNFSSTGTIALTLSSTPSNGIIGPSGHHRLTLPITAAASIGAAVSGGSLSVAYGGYDPNSAAGV